ncbi:MAG: hypothetical protein RLZZ200_764 [Pseudomonadota bacterium]
MRDNSPSTRFDLLACAAYTLLCLAWTWWAGRDQNWDLLNYHVYVAQAWWQERIPGEWLAAAGQSYLNPLPHLPFYALLSLGWHSLPIGSLLALIHSINLWLLHGIAVRVIPEGAPGQRLFVVGGVLLGGLAPAFLLETGTSFVDVLVSLPSLGALLCVLAWIQRRGSAGSGGYGPLWLAFGLAGLAIGLKPTAALFGVALGLGTLLTSWRKCVAICWRAALAASTGWLASGGAHAWKLWTAFGNPVFPMFNQVFRSPYFVGESVAIDRFRPASLADALCYPLDLANAFRLRGLEGISVDLRPLSLLCLLAVLCAAAFSRRTQLQPGRTTVLLSVTLGISLSLWLATSGNIRYSIESFLLIGPMIALIASKAGGPLKKPALAGLALLIAAQATYAVNLNMVRFGGSQNSRWETDWVAVDLPTPLARQPAYYLSLQIQSFSLLARHLPPQARLSNIVGQVTLDPRSATWQAILADRDARRLPWRSLYGMPSVQRNGSIPTYVLDHQDALLSTYGLRALREDCQFIDLNGRDLPPLHWAEVSKVFKADSSGRAAVISCALQPAAALTTDEIRRRAIMDARISRWEDRCPALFAPRTSSEQGVQSRSRFYGKSDTTLSITTMTGKLYMRKATLGLSVQLEDADGRAQVDGCPDLRTANQDGGRSR